MDTELRKADVGRYSNADHIEFHKTSDDIFDRYKTVINDPVLLTAYRTKVTQEDQIYKWMRRSEFTEKKAEADHERDKIFLAIVENLHSFEKHFDPSLRDNAKHVLNLIGNYRNLTHTDYDAETAGIDSILERLNSADYLPAVQNLQLAPWLTELTRLNTLFKSYAVDTEEEQVKKPDISPKAARNETDEAFRKITLRITSIIDLGLVDDIVYKPLVKEFNVHVDHYNTLVHERYGRLHVKTDISQGEIEPIEVQQYTGEPVYVIPSVKVSKTEKDGTVTVIKLKFSEDFTVGYKNNTGPGTATLTISGIGKYTGEIVTTFNIAAIE
ncbi:MAG: DUF6261 family protein [Tannerella sp.]|jgi:hypothetical protein|nr:DUF6261 family protein [Tannerella sp.]